MAYIWAEFIAEITDRKDALQAQYDSLEAQNAIVEANLLVVTNRLAKLEDLLDDVETFTEG